MIHNLLRVFVLLALAASPCAAQDWAVKMFSATSHDFGAVARGAKTQFSFQLKNIYQEDVHIVGVRSSCGCTTPQISKHDLKTYETGEIVAEFNTRAFVGKKSATLTVTLDKPFYAEVQLTVSGHIRSDVVLQPGQVDFGSIEQGATTEKKIEVSYAGREDWRLMDAKSPNPYLEVELTELTRTRGRVSYEMIVRLTKDAPSGYVKDQLVLVTNDAKNPELALDVEGRVISEITVSPATLFMGVVAPGQSITKQLLIRGKKPFRIVDVLCDDKSFTAETVDELKTIHRVPVIFTAGEKSGKITRTISIATDEGGGSTTVTAYAEVVGDPTPN